MSGHVLVVGAGQAGVQLACSLRDRGYPGRITLVGDEPHPPYQRPPLSKAYLKGAVTRDALALRAAGYYAARHVELVLGDGVVAVRRHTDGSGEAVCASGRTIAFTTLVLATGARPRALDIEGADAAGVHTLRDIDDAEALSVALESATEVVVIGGGFVGLEVAATARAGGKRVTVLEAASQLLGRAVGPETARHVAELHRSAGIDVRLGEAPARIVTDGARVSAVELADGARVRAQLVVVGIGAVPHTRLAKSLGLVCDRGIVVDAFSRASDGTALAVGDCARVPDPTPAARAGTRVRMESVDHAVQQADAATATILGERRPYTCVPWFWSDQGDLRIRIAGLRASDDTPVTRHLGDRARCLVGYYRDGRLAAVEAVNATSDFMAVKRALAAGVEITASDLMDPGVSLKILLKAVSADAVSSG
ncbi:NAD(P)/FAD-dependent oxidoreductase [Streptomyces soliscabiei]|uniref:NAD(P)/FAD-dependent oxidoreductase n=1 Tax=Streptomyces soliscabiei TaxID=588897 RepID=UPI0029BB78DE|nr:FAD-dependent oxidoreductase [Streptomyces sp. NY05-11A]MDX2676685.1 FAD-dependent oxidoreductase [Streptomyces sp. NY05-11A]